ncbi:MAG: hypothetical protein APF76_03235 [Desulfitibacter sp. BRH_c19]|nr:MAG: hypothetical protein APF76_03235 [Desulfitibacter sp. BRH_c19]
MPVHLNNEQLLELFLAVIFREAGYIAGIPRRYIEGRGGIHQVSFIIVEKNLVPFSNDTVLIPKFINGDYDNQWQQIMWLSGVVNDLQQARPKNYNPLPDASGQSVGEYFHKIYGGVRSDGEFLSVEYKGILLVFGTNIFSKIRQYANSQGIAIMCFPEVYCEKQLDTWIDITKKQLYSSFENSTINIKGLLHHTRKISDYRKLLKKIRRQNPQLSPEEYHDLLTILYALLKEPKLRPLLDYLRKMIIGSLDSQPVLLEVNNITNSQLIVGAADFFKDIAKKYKNRNLLLSKRLGFRGEVDRENGKALYHINLYPDDNYHPVPDNLKDMRLKAYVSGEQIDSIREKKTCLKIMIKDGLILTADILLVK